MILRTSLFAPRLVPLLLPWFIVLGISLAISYAVLSFPLLNPIVLAAIIDKIALDTLILLLSIRILTTVARRPRCAALFAAFYFALTLLDAGTMLHAQMRWNLALTTRIRPESFRAFFGPEEWCLCLLWFCATLLFARQLTRATASLRLLSIPRTVIFGLLIWTINVPERLTDLTVWARHLDGTVAEFENRHMWQQLSFLRSNTILRLLAECVRATQPPVAPTPLTSLPRWQNAVDRFHLGLGRASSESTAEKAGARPFKKVIFISVESLSLDLLAPYNSAIPPGTTPFLSSNEISEGMWTNYRTSRLPTIQGLSTTFHSHPNSDLFLRPNSADPSPNLISVLRENGYRTIHMRGSSRYFASEFVLFRSWGFQEFVAKEDFAERYSSRYLTNWGLVDRYLLDEVFDKLRKNPDEKQFLHVLTVDTHLPHGRDDYGDLRYPSTVRSPLDLNSDLAGMLTAISRFDHDLSLFVTRLKASELWNDDLLLIISADHCCPRAFALHTLPGYPIDPLCRLPLIVLTPRPLPFAKKDAIGSQLDLAPTIVALNGIPVPPGWWGRNLYENRSGTWVGMFAGRLSALGPDGVERFLMNSPSTPEQKLLAELFEQRFR